MKYTNVSRKIKEAYNEGRITKKEANMLADICDLYINWGESLNDAKAYVKNLYANGYEPEYSIV